MYWLGRSNHITKLVTASELLTAGSTTMASGCRTPELMAPVAAALGDPDPMEDTVGSRFARARFPITSTMKVERTEPGKRSTFDAYRIS